MNNSSGNYLPSLFVPSRCSGSADNIPAFLKCLATRGFSSAGRLSGAGLSAIAKRNLAVKRVAAVSEVSAYLCNDIGMTQGQYIAAQLATVLEDNQAD